MRSLFGHLLKIASALVVILTLLAYVCPYVNPIRFSWLAFFGTAFPWILLANVLLLVIWAVQRNRFANTVGPGDKKSLRLFLLWLSDCCC